MAAGGPKRTRSERVAALGLAPGQWERAWANLRRRDVLGRIGMALLTALLLAGVVRAWDPPFAFRDGYTPSRDIVSRIAFSKVDRAATEVARQRARDMTLAVYTQDPRPLVELRKEVAAQLAEMTAAKSLADLKDPSVWDAYRLKSDEKVAPKRPGPSAPRPAGKIGAEEPGSEPAPAATDSSQEDTSNDKPAAVAEHARPSASPQNDPAGEAADADDAAAPTDDSALREPAPKTADAEGGDAEPADNQATAAAEEAPQEASEDRQPVSTPPTDSTPEPAPKGVDPDEAHFRAFCDALKDVDVDAALQAAFVPFERRGLARQITIEPGRVNRDEIFVHPEGQGAPLEVVEVAKVIAADDGAALRKSLLAQFKSTDVVDRLMARIGPKWKKMATLAPDEAMSQRVQNEAAAAVSDVLANYEVGQPLVKAGQPLDAQKLEILAAEHDAVLAARTVAEKLTRLAAVTGLFFGMFVLCGLYMRFRQRGPLASISRLSVILALVVITVALARWASIEPWRAELIPLMLFGMTMAIVYRQEMALLLSGAVTLMLVLALGHGMMEFLVLMAAVTVADLNMGRIRSRSKLIYVGLSAAAVVVVLELALGVIADQPIGHLLVEAAQTGGWAIAAGFLMTGLLPFIERLFGVLTDLSLLELGDVAHPLLQELVRRAPSTYNHSVTVGSIAEAAADAIGARGLLVRVGAYFHDIGKMLKPGYFIENQGAGDNRHEGLVPTMSSLVIVAHIKDGADLARKYHLPQPIVDLIEQHHGTTRVGFFYERAAEQQKANPDGGKVDENSFRYPGPKPQTKEAAVLMLADGVESASRTLVDPTPSRIESLVRDIAERRLRGGQFDDSGVTLRELRTIERSMVMSLTSIYHGRIKYPDQKTA